MPNTCLATRENAYDKATRRDEQLSLANKICGEE